MSMDDPHVQADAFTIDMCSCAAKLPAKLASGKVRFVCTVLCGLELCFPHSSPP